MDAVPLRRALERDGQELVQDGLDFDVAESSALGHRLQHTAKPHVPRKRLGHRNEAASPPSPPRHLKTTTDPQKPRELPLQRPYADHPSFPPCRPPTTIVSPLSTDSLDFNFF